MRSYLISADRKAITCRRCWMTSYNPHDVRNHYCGKCRTWHDDPNSVAALPRADTKHWTIKRKAAILEAIRVNRISPEEAGLLYNLSAEELLAWQEALAQHGIGGLKATAPRVKKN
jgi:hypothetical protein